MSNHAEDEEPDVVRRVEPARAPLPPGLTRSEEQFVPTTVRVSSRGVFAVVAAFILLLLVVLAVWLYFGERKVERRRATIESGLPIETPNPKPTPPAWASGEIVPVFPEMLRVTSTALGNVPLAIVNGKRVAEGDWVDVTTDKGVATLVVDKIDDGVVHFRNGEIKIDPKLATGPPHKDSH